MKGLDGGLNDITDSIEHDFTRSKSNHNSDTEINTAMQVLPDDDVQDPIAQAEHDATIFDGCIATGDEKTDKEPNVNCETSQIQCTGICFDDVEAEDDAIVQTCRGQGKPTEADDTEAEEDVVVGVCQVQGEHGRVEDMEAEEDVDVGAFQDEREHARVEIMEAEDNVVVGICQDYTKHPGVVGMEAKGVVDVATCQDQGVLTQVENMEAENENYEMGHTDVDVVEAANDVDSGICKEDHVVTGMEEVNDLVVETCQIDEGNSCIGDVETENIDGRVSQNEGDDPSEVAQCLDDEEVNDAQKTGEEEVEVDLAFRKQMKKGMFQER